MDRIIVTLKSIGNMVATLSGTAQLSVGMSSPEVVQTNPFIGEYEYIPTQEVQTIPIEGLRATSNIVINAIPNNYGLITWNGEYLTVS